MDIRLNRNTVIADVHMSGPVKRAADNLQRDLHKVCTDAEKPGAVILLEQAGSYGQECFCLEVREDSLVIRAGDELGFVYGLYEISRRFLGVSNFWFWNDQEPEIREEIVIPEGFSYLSHPFRVRLRGWFVNDEVLLHTWKVNRREEEPWEMVFEALLRCGGNMVIPGTDRNSKKWSPLASKMGLYLTHHHAEPLGAEMFARAYPNLNPSYDEHPDKFRKLWEEAVRRQRGKKVIWNLGFRGQGDCPFWASDPRYRTPELRGALMSRLIRMQYDLVKQYDTDAVCCTNLYGETMELYQGGYLEFPEDVIRIWADNGYGRMVTRRQENHNPRIEALPMRGQEGKHGIYYHVSFYDLQASNHITMLPNSPRFVRRELCRVLEHNASDYWLINCSNVKPHVYFLDYISEIWKSGDADPEIHGKTYVSEYYKEGPAKNHGDEIYARMKEYFQWAPAYGAHEDEHAGEQFPNYGTRILISQFMRDRNKRAEEFVWACDSVKLTGQIRWYHALSKKSSAGYEAYLEQCRRTDTILGGSGRELYRDSILLQAKLHYFCWQGAAKAAEALLLAEKEEYQRAFYAAGKARKAYLCADVSMRQREHGKWHGFYANECLTDIKQTAWVLEGLMSTLRNLGDGPYYYQWQREFLYSEEDKRVVLIMNMENHLKDLELFARMEEKWDK